jgi:beta-N-acetylhexosaminidase
MVTHKFRSSSVLIGSLLLLYAASHPQQPYLLAIRSFETPLVVMLSLVVLVAATRMMSVTVGTRRWRGISIAMPLVAMLLSIGNNQAFLHQRDEVHLGGAPLQTVGNHFVIGYSNFDEIASLASRGLIGGVYLGRDFAKTRSAHQIKAEILALQSLRAQAGLPPLIVAADQEGGQVAHLTPPLDPLPALASLVEDGTDALLEERARSYGATQGAGLSALGVNLNLGPVADLRPSGPRPFLDTHTLLNRRAISADPVIVTRITSAYNQGLREEGVTGTLKHFPGLARTRADTHHFAAELNASLPSLSENDWLPFRAASRNGAAIMLGHVTISGLDTEQPASLSRKIVQTLLRDEWGYDGLLITDDLNMGAVFRKGICKTAVAALAAGVDLLLISYDPDQYYAAITCAANAFERSVLDPQSLAKSRSRIRTVASYDRFSAI